MIDVLVKEMKAAGTPARAKQEMAYLKSTREHFGVTVPVGRSILKKYVKTLILADIKALWKTDVHELRWVAADALVMRPALLSAKDAPMIERMLRESETWALVDVLSPSVMGPLLQKHPELEKTVDKWARDKDFWMRRSALLVDLLALRKGGDFSRFERYADLMLTEKEFFIQKAMGWVLREVAKKRPTIVKQWLKTHECSALTRREASKHL